jgi:hypothetical protein
MQRMQMRKREMGSGRIPCHLGRRDHADVVVVVVAGGGVAVEAGAAVAGAGAGIVAE